MTMTRVDSPPGPSFREQGSRSRADTRGQGARPGPGSLK